MAMHREDLIQKLTQARPFLMGQNFIPILNHFCFDGDSVTAYNDVAGIRLSLQTDLHCAIHGDVLLQLLNTMSGETVSVDSDKKDKITVRSGKTKVKLPTLSSEDFVFTLPNTDASTEFELSTGLLKGLEKCLVGVSTELSHPEITGVTWQLNETGVTLYSTDNVTLSKFHLPISNFYSDEYIVITPAFFCEQLIALAKEYADDTFTMWFDEDFVLAELGENGMCYVFSRLISNKAVIDFEKAISMHLTPEDPPVFQPFPAELEGTLKRAEILLKVSMTDRASMGEAKEDLLRITTTSPYGNSTDELNFDKPILGEFEFEFNPRLWIRGLKQADKIAVLGRSTALKTDDGKFYHLIAHAKV